MGLLDNIKDKIRNMINKNKIKKLPEGQGDKKSVLSSFDLSDLGLNSSITLSDNTMRRIASIKEAGYTNYPNGEIKKLMIAEVSNEYTDLNHILSGPEFSNIVFEMPPQENITQTLLNKIVQYSEGFRKQNAQLDMYIGELNGNPEDLQVRLNDSVNSHVNSNLIPSFQNDRNQARVNSVKREPARSFEESLKVNIEEINRNTDLERQQRLNNPFLTDMGRSVRNPELLNYNGVNLTNGDILKLRNLNKVGKDENGVYLYQGFIDSSMDNSSKIGGDNYIGGNYVPICFTTTKKIEDIVRSQNINEINSMLSMLSNPQIFMEQYCSKKQMNYIGHLNTDERINGQSDNLSNTMRNSIYNIQTKFSEQIKSQDSNYYGR